MRATQHLRIRSYEAKHGEPARVVDDASRRRDEGRGSFDQVWCVFDVEAPARQGIAQLIQSAQHEGLHVAWSNPCFEFWLILHFADHHQAFVSSKAVADALHALHPGYSKALLDTDAVLAGREEAMARSASIRRRHERDGRDIPASNPSTTVDVLVASLTGR